MKKKLLLSMFVVSGFASHPQVAIKHLSLDEAVTAAGSENNAIRLSALDVEIAREKFRQTDALFLPQANISYTAVTTTNPLNAFASKLQQKAVAAEDFNAHLLNHPPATPDFSGKFELQQPILNLDMFKLRKGAAKQVEMVQLLSNRTKEHIRFETEKAYLQLQIAYEEIDVLNEALMTFKALYKSSEDYYKQGLIQKSDLLNAELQVTNTETQVNKAKSAIQDGSDMLNLLMGRTASVVYTADPIRLNNDVAINDSVYDDRSDFQALQKGMESYDMMIKAARMSNLPRLNAFATYQVNNKNLFGFNSGAYATGLQLSWNIFNGNRTKSTISQQRLEKEKLAEQLDQQKSEAQLQISYSRRQLSDARFVMKQQQLAIEQASEALRVLRNRYTQGLVKTTDVLMAQTQLSQQKIEYVHAMFDYNLAAVSLRFFTTGK